MTSRPAAPKRVTSEAIVKPPCKIHSLAIISDKAQITGTNPVEIGESTVLHPYANIKADNGNVVIGKNCTISEDVVIGVATPTNGEELEVVIGDAVNIESRAIVEAKSIGDGTLIDVRAKIGKGAVIGKHCKIGPLCVVKEDEEVEDYTVIFGDNERRVNLSLANNPEIRETKLKGQLMHVELLKKLIPDGSSKWR